MKAPFFTTGEYEEKTMGRRELRESIFQLLFYDRILTTIRRWQNRNNCIWKQSKIFRKKIRVIFRKI